MWPPWLKLLRHHQNRNNGAGLTIPFIVGALRTPPGSLITDQTLGIAEVESLLVSMRDETPESCYVRIADCDWLEQPVVSTNDIRYAGCFRNSYVGFSTTTDEGPLLLVQPKYCPDKERGITSVATTLWGRYADAIMSGRFSFRDGTFQPYDSTDLQFIYDAYAAQSDEET